MSDETPAAPPGLTGPGRDLWTEVTELWTFRPDELVLLRQICETTSLLSRLEEASLTADFLVRGSVGQLVANPILQELRAHRATLTTMIRTLGLVDLEDEGGELPAYRSAASVRASRAATARWGSKSGRTVA